MRFISQVGAAAVMTAALVGCASQLDTQRLRIEDLDRYLGTADSLEHVDGVRIAPPEEVPKGDRDQEQHEAQMAHIVSMLKTGTPQHIELSSVRRSTLENNLGLQSSLLGPEIATEQLRAEQAKFESTFTASVQQQRTISRTYYGGAGLVDIETDSLSVVPGLTVPLRTGGTVSLDWTMGTRQYEGSGATQASSMASPTISLQQPLLRTAGFDYNEASIVLAAANAGSQRGQAQLEVINQLVAAEIGYWNLYLAWRTLTINVELYNTSRKLLDEQRELVNHGSGSIANVYNFEVSLAQSVDQVLATERSLRLAVRALKLIMQDPDMSLDGSVALKPATDPRLIAYEFNPERLVAYALGNRADLLQLEYTQIQAAIDVMVKDNLVLPQVDFQGSYTFNGFAPGLSIRQANETLFRGTDPQGWMFGVNVSVPIGNEVALSNHRAALLQRLQAIADVRNREITVTSEVLDAIDTCEIRWEQILTTDYQQHAAKRFFAAYQTLFRRGEIPSSNLTQALQTLASSQVQAAAAEAQYQIALAQLAQSAGCLLGHAGVEWGPYLNKDGLEAAFPSPAETVPDGFIDTLGEGGASLEELSPDSSNGRRDAGQGHQ